MPIVDADSWTFPNAIYARKTGIFDTFIIYYKLLSNTYWVVCLCAIYSEIEALSFFPLKYFVRKGIHL